MDIIKVNGMDVKAETVRTLNKNVTLPDLNEAIEKNGLDEIVVKDPQTNKTYVAWGQDMNLDSLKNLQNGYVPTVTINGKKAEIILFDNEINSAKEGAQKALGLSKNLAISAGKLIADGGSYLTTAKTASGAFVKATALVGSIWGMSQIAVSGTILGGAAAAVGTAGMAIYGAARGSNESGLLKITH